MFSALRFKKYFSLGICFLLISISAQGSVVVTGTRVIYNGGDREKTVRLTNQDEFPNIVQSWIDQDEIDKSPELVKTPFFITPPIFRMEAGTGQNLRIIYTGDQTLPQDRESLFHLNILQIPPRNAAHSENNQMLLMLRNRLKLFYRPADIAGAPEELPQNLRFQLKQETSGWVVEVENPTGYFASFGSAFLVTNTQEIPLKAEMVAPGAKARWLLESAVDIADNPVKLRAQLINDYGARVELLKTLRP